MCNGDRHRCWLDFVSLLSSFHIIGRQRGDFFPFHFALFSSAAFLTVDLNELLFFPHRFPSSDFSSCFFFKKVPFTGITFFQIPTVEANGRGMCHGHNAKCLKTEHVIDRALAVSTLIASLLWQFPL